MPITVLVVVLVLMIPINILGSVGVGSKAIVYINKSVVRVNQWGAAVQPVSHTRTPAHLVNTSHTSPLPRNTATGHRTLYIVDVWFCSLQDEPQQQQQLRTT